VITNILLTRQTQGSEDARHDDTGRTLNIVIENGAAITKLREETSRIGIRKILSEREETQTNVGGVRSQDWNGTRGGGGLAHIDAQMRWDCTRQLHARVQVSDLELQQDGLSPSLLRCHHELLDELIIQLRSIARLTQTDVERIGQMCLIVRTDIERDG
jgi:hypothetical protein